VFQISLIVAAIVVVMALMVLADRVKRRVGIDPTFDRTKRQYRTNEAATQTLLDHDPELR
jgi:hypothetical protein